MAEIPTVKTLTNNLRRIAALPQKQHPERWFRTLTQKDGESDAAYRVRALDVIGARWDNRSGNTVRSMEGGSRNGKDSHAFMRDLQRYGACKFDEETGALDTESLDLGPDPLTYLNSLPKRRRPTPPAKTFRRGARA